MSVKLGRKFTRELRAALGLYAVWPPGQDVRPGTYGILEGTMFRSLGTIMADFQVEAKCYKTQPRLQLEYKSQDISEVTGYAGTTVGTSPSPGTRLTTKLSFAGAGSSYFKVRNAAYITLEEPSNVNSKIVNSFSNGRWLANYVLVHGVFEADATSIIVSGGAQSEIEIEGDANVGPLDLADMKTQLTCKSERNIAVKILGDKGVTSLMALSRLVPRNRLLNLLGQSEKYIKPYFQETETETSAATVLDNTFIRLPREPSAEDIVELRMDPGELFHLVELP